MFFKESWTGLNHWARFRMTVMPEAICGLSLVCIVITLNPEFNSMCRRVIPNTTRVHWRCQADDNIGCAGKPCWRWVERWRPGTLGAMDLFHAVHNEWKTCRRKHVRVGGWQNSSNIKARLWPEIWSSMSKAAQHEGKQHWAVVEAKLDSARNLKGIYFIVLDDMEFNTMKNARGKLELPNGIRHALQGCKPWTRIKVRRRHKWRPQKLLMWLQGCKGQAADAVSAETQVKMGEALALVRLSRHLDMFTATQVAQITVQHWRTGCFSWTKSVWSPTSRFIVGKTSWKSSIGTRLGKSTKLGMLVCASKTRFIPIGKREWQENGWKETESQFHVEEMDENTLIWEEPTSFLDHVYLGCTQREGDTMV